MIPKGFNTPAALRAQRNAILSWKAAHAPIQIILLGDDPGVEAFALEHQLEWGGPISRSELGTPRLDAAFAQAARLAQHSLLAYVNADIIVDAAMLRQITSITMSGFLLVSQRTNILVEHDLDFGSPEVTHAFFDDARSKGQLQGPAAIDLFLFDLPSPLVNLPEFYVGRPGWDNWMIAQARRKGLAVIDATPAITMVHQDHDYGHVPQGKNNTWRGPEADLNLAKIGPVVFHMTIMDATHQLTAQGVIKAKGFKRHIHRWITTAALKCEHKPGGRRVVSLCNQARIFLGWLGKKLRG